MNDIEKFLEKYGAYIVIGMYVALFVAAYFDLLPNSAYFARSWL